jgi:hypothetical protein
MPYVGTCGLVNDDEGQTWSHNADVVADDGGGLIYEFTLPDWFVATYTVTATGEMSGTARTSFTDTVQATASVNPTDSYRGRSNTYTFTVTNTSNASETLRSLRVTPPNGEWSLTACTTSRSQWSGSVSGGNCVFESTGNAIPVSGSATFTVTANISPGGNDIIAGSWGARVSPQGTYVNNQAFSAPASTGGSLAANAYVFEVLDAVARAPTVNAGDPCPTANKTATAGSSQVIVVCGRSGRSGTLTPVSSSSSLAGTMIGSAGTFNSGSVPGNTNTASIVLANYSARAITSSAGSGKTVAVKIGSASNQTSPLVTINSSNYSASFNDKNVGTDKPVTVTGVALGGASNYTVSQPSGLKADIDPVVLTPSVTVNNKTYDGTTGATINTPGFTNPDAIVSGETVTLQGGSAVFATADAGENKAVNVTGLSLGGSGAPNYSLSSTSTAAQANIDKRSVTASITAANKTYDGTTAATINGCTLNSPSGNVGVLQGDTNNVGCSASNGAFGSAGAGTGKQVSADVSLTGSAKDNYQLASNTASTTADILRKELTVTADDQSKTYDGNAFTAFTRTITGFVNNETESVISGSVTYSGSAVGAINAGTYTITPEVSGLSANNYTFKAVNGTLTIDKATPTVNITWSHATYDGTTHPASATVSGVGTAPENVGAANSLTYYAGSTTMGIPLSAAPKDDGTYMVKAVFNGNSNYNAASNTKTITINTKELTGSFTAIDKVYDGNTNAEVTATLIGVIPGDDVKLAGPTGIFDDKNVGTPKTVTVNTGDLSGLDAGNYKLAAGPWTATAAIEKAPLAISAVSQTKVYDGTTASTGKPTVNGLKNGDTVTGLTRAFQSKDVMGANLSTLEVTGYTVNDGNSGGNYSVTTQTESGTITKALLTIEPNPKTPSRQYSDPNPSFSPSYTGFVNNETDAVLGTKPTCSSVATTSSGPGSYAISCSGGVGNNYSFSYQPGTLSVTKEDASAEFSGATYYSTPTAGGSVTVTLTAGSSLTTANQYTVGIVVNNWYTRNASTDDSIVTVAQSVAGSISGGGHLVNSNSGGRYAGDPGQKTNFGFNVRLDKNGSPKGQINTIDRRNGRVYQIKGSAMTSLTTKVCATGASSATCPGTATFNGKANIQDITNPLAPVSIDGNASLQVTMTDKGELGKDDTIGITLWDKNGGLWFSSNWVSPKTVEQLLGGGNLVVR